MNNGIFVDLNFIRFIEYEYMIQLSHTFLSCNRRRHTIVDIGDDTEQCVKRLAMDVVVPRIVRQLVRRWLWLTECDRCAQRVNTDYILADVSDYDGCGS